MNVEKAMGWVGGTVLAVITIGFFALGSFESKASAERAYEYINSRLDRIEKKLDVLLDR